MKCPRCEMDVPTPSKAWVLKEIKHGRKLLVTELYKCPLCGETFKVIRKVKAKP